MQSNQIMRQNAASSDELSFMFMDGCCCSYYYYYDDMRRLTLILGMVTVGGLALAMKL